MSRHVKLPTARGQRCKSHIDLNGTNTAQIINACCFADVDQQAGAASTHTGIAAGAQQ